MISIQDGTSGSTDRLSLNLNVDGNGGSKREIAHLLREQTED